MMGMSSKITSRFGHSKLGRQDDSQKDGYDDIRKFWTEENSMKEENWQSWIELM